MVSEFLRTNSVRWEILSRRETCDFDAGAMFEESAPAMLVLVESVDVVVFVASSWQENKPADKRREAATRESFIEIVYSFSTISLPRKVKSQKSKFKRKLFPSL
jgi:hypothetical protein